MYKDDNMITPMSGNDAMLRILLDQKGAAPRCDLGSCEQNTRNYDNGDNRSWGLEGYPLASVFAPLQKFENVYEMEKAICRGTMFADLDLPFEGTTVQKGGNCRG